ncbi:MAG: hypothetical protein WBE76_23780 [Terracidiphilus sp.]
MQLLGKKSATLSLAGHPVTVDREDADRIAVHEWKVTRGDRNQILFYREAGRPGQHFFQLLGAFVLDVAPGVYVELIKSDGQSMLDYRKSNLRVRQCFRLGRERTLSGAVAPST